MKKLFAIALAVVIMMSLTLPVSAATSSASGSAADLAPTVSVATEGVKITTADAAADLTEEEQKIFAEAKEALAEAVPQDMAVEYFFNVAVEQEGSEATLDLGDIENTEDLKIMQFINGEWVELEFIVNADGTITVKNVGNGPMAICTK